MSLIKTVLFLVLLSLFLISCGGNSDTLQVRNIRLEDGPYTTFFDDPGPVYNVTAEWDENRVDLRYQLAADTVDEDNFRVTRFESPDGYTFQPVAKPGETARMVYLTEAEDVAWRDLDLLQAFTANDFIFVLQNTTSSEYTDMVYLPGGEFNMGSRYHRDELPVHPVVLNPFYMDKFEVTVAEYREFCKATNREFPRQPDWSGLRHPVVNVSWFDANAYAKWKGKRLPTEAEWEYAAKSGVKDYKFSWGNRNPEGKLGGNIADEAVRAEKPRWAIWKRYFDGYIYSAPVGSFKSNELGIFDLTGNVWEWCQDWYDVQYYEKSPQQNPGGPAEGSHKVLRGGSWNYGPKDIITSRRQRFRPRVTLDYIGFRCVKDLP
jgi:sulfatase modifying factor 1